MESVSVRRFLGSGYGDGDGDGTGYGSGYGSGSGYGFGSGYGSGSGGGFGSGYGYGFGSGYGGGFGSGSGDGDGDGYGSGDGDGYGYGSGDGDGYGSGDGYGIKSYNGMAVYEIDGIATILTRVIGSVAKGFILQSDLTLMPCFVVKSGNLYAHGGTLAEARDALQEKILDNLDPEEKIAMFMAEFKRGAKYPAKKFYDWHHTLTGSCDTGRKAWIKDRGIDLETAEYTVEEFIALTENAYNGEIIRQLKEAWNKGT